MKCRASQVGDFGTVFSSAGLLPGAKHLKLESLERVFVLRRRQPGAKKENLLRHPRAASAHSTTINIKGGSYRLKDEKAGAIATGL